MYGSLNLTLAFIALIGYHYIVVNEEPSDNLWHRWNYMFSWTENTVVGKDASSPKLMEANMTVVNSYFIFEASEAGKNQVETPKGNREGGNLQYFKESHTGCKKNKIILIGCFEVFTEP